MTTIIRKAHTRYDVRRELKAHARRFKPGDEYRAPKLNAIERVEEPIDLKELEDGTVLAIKGYHRAADYVLRVYSCDGEKMVTVWRDPEMNGLESKIDNIITLTREADRYYLRTGKIVPGKSVALPYFDYENGQVKQPKDLWIDCARVWREAK